MQKPEELHLEAGRVNVFFFSEQRTVVCVLKPTNVYSFLIYNHIHRPFND